MITENEKKIIDTAGLRANAISEMLDEFLHGATKYAGDKLDGLTTHDVQEQYENRIMMVQNNGSYLFTGSMLRKMFRIIEEKQHDLVDKRGLFGKSKAPFGLVDQLSDIIAGRMFKELIEHADELQEIISGDRDEELEEKRED
jgi:hypothetical protein